MTDFNITPPTELVEQWRTAPEYATGTEKITAIYMTTRRLQEIADQAANWGWDQREPEIRKARDEELEAMLAELKALHLPDGYGNRLRDARRPNQADAALEALNEMDKPLGEVTGRRCATIRTALERLKELEANKSMSNNYIHNPVQIAECGGPCEEGGPEACDCGALRKPDQLKDIAWAASDLLCGMRHKSFAEEHGGVETLTNNLRVLVDSYEYGPRPVPGVDIPDEDGVCGDLVDLCRAEGVDPKVGIPLLERARDVVWPAKPSELTEYQPTQITVPEATLKRALIALEVGLEAAIEEHGNAIHQYSELRPHRVKWYAEQVELITTAINDLRRDTGWTQT